MYYIKVEGKPKDVKKSVAHMWIGNDTVCKMASTGGLNTSTYVVSETTRGKSVCVNCLHLYTPVQDDKQLTLW